MHRLKQGLLVCEIYVILLEHHKKRAGKKRKKHTSGPKMKVMFTRQKC